MYFVLFRFSFYLLPLFCRLPLSFAFTLLPGLRFTRINRPAIGIYLFGFFYFVRLHLHSSHNTCVEFTYQCIVYHGMNASRSAYNIYNSHSKQTTLLKDAIPMIIDSINTHTKICFELCLLLNSQFAFIFLDKSPRNFDNFVLLFFAQSNKSVFFQAVEIPTLWNQYSSRFVSTRNTNNEIQTDHIELLTMNEPMNVYGIYSHRSHSQTGSQTHIHVRSLVLSFGDPERITLFRSHSLHLLLSFSLFIHFVLSGFLSSFISRESQQENKIHWVTFFPHLTHGCVRLSVDNPILCFTHFKPI